MPRRIDQETERKAIELYIDQRLSERSVADKLGISHGTVRLILLRHGKPRRELSEACMIYPKKDFSGNLSEQARMMAFTEDYYVTHEYQQIGAHTSTTHPAQIEIFYEIFGDYGRIYKGPIYNPKTSQYGWELKVRLNPSFRFLLEYKRDRVGFFNEVVRAGNHYVYIGALEVESSIGVYNNNGSPMLTFKISNKNKRLLECVQTIIGGNVHRGNGCYDLRLYGKEALGALRRLSFTHREKVAAKELILQYVQGAGRSYAPLLSRDVLETYRVHRRSIKQEVKKCVWEARLEYIRRHGRAHPLDPDK